MNNAMRKAYEKISASELAGVYCRLLDASDQGSLNKEKIGVLAEVCIELGQRSLHERFEAYQLLEPCHKRRFREVFLVRRREIAGESSAPAPA